jgi:ribose transport system ATP-binding protein
VHIATPRQAVRAGICLLTEDRKAQGLILDMACDANVTITDLARVSRAGLMNAGAERSAAQALVDELDIKTPSLDQLVRNLSGGNQQKVVLAKWMLTEPHLLMLDEPTKGVDVGAKYEIHELIRAQAAKGMACLLVSSDLPEVLALAHRIVVMREGVVQGELGAREAGEESVMRLATAVRH